VCRTPAVSENGGMCSGELSNALLAADDAPVVGLLGWGEEPTGEGLEVISRLDSLPPIGLAHEIQLLSSRYLASIRSMSCQCSCFRRRAGCGRSSPTNHFQPFSGGSSPQPVALRQEHHRLLGERWKALRNTSPRFLRLQVYGTLLFPAFLTLLLKL